MKRTTGWLAGGYVLSATACALATLRSRAAFGDLSIYAAGGAAVLHGTPLYQLRFAFGLRFHLPAVRRPAVRPAHLAAGHRRAGPGQRGHPARAAGQLVPGPTRLPPWPARRWWIQSRERAAQLALAFSAAAICPSGGAIRFPETREW